MLSDEMMIPVGSVSAVGSHVGCDAAWLGEFAIANVATKWFLSAVGSAMCGQVGSLREGLVTLNAPTASLSFSLARRQIKVSLPPVRSLSSVCPEMSFQCWRSGIALATDSANILAIRGGVGRWRGRIRRHATLSHPKHWQSRSIKTCRQ